MAKPLRYEVPEPDWKVGKNADEELREFIELLHSRGVLRVANTLLGSLPSVSQIVMEGVQNQSGSNAVQNLSSLVQLIGDVPPEQFRRVCRGVTEGMEAALEEANAEREPSKLAGIKGALRLMRDDEFWQEAAPLLEASRAFLRAMHKNTDEGPHGGPHATER